MIESLCICGAGTMGSGIAQLAAQKGMNVILFDVNEPMLIKAKAGIKSSLESLIDKRKIDATEYETILSRIFFTTRLKDCRAPVIIEAVIEEITAKTALINSLVAMNDQETIFASNTSSLSVAAIADGTDCAERIAGMHFFNPPRVMPLVEIIVTRHTSDKTKSTLLMLAMQLGKEVVVCTDAPGFIVNRVARPFYLESLRLLEQGVSDIDTIDRLVESAGFKMGPFRLMDLIGNDINLTVSKSLYDALGRPARLMPSALQERKVTAGEFGKKTNNGFYNYTA